VFTVLGFSFGWLALSAVVAVIDVLTTVFAIAVTVYVSLALIGVLVFTAIGIRRLITRRRNGPEQPGYRSSPHAVSSRVGNSR
jgi:uncharacterized membrane protein YhaH (DUF805 family)